MLRPTVSLVRGVVPSARRNVTAAASFEFDTLHELGEKSLAHGDRPSLGERQADGTWKWLTYAERHALTKRSAAALTAHGVTGGARVALISRNSVEWATTS